MAAIPGGTPSTFSAAQALTLLLTTESLLFAALNVSVALATPVVGGRNIRPRSIFHLAAAVALALGVVAAAAGLAWWQIFASPWPDSWFMRGEAVGIAVGILAEVGIAVAITKAVRR
ncbi:MAG TPA: hypothetical protein VGO31_01460 [Microbacteriaceae bacterium]|jgi:hypothetical protein|nr:hypothetical protein [Microbacteriaceae bacterium]